MHPIVRSIYFNRVRSAHSRFSTLLKTIGPSLEEVDLGNLGDMLTPQLDRIQTVSASIVLLTISGDLTPLARGDLRGKNIDIILI
jgi:hypothetical protein